LKHTLFKSILEKFNLLLDAENPLQGLGYNNVLFIATELLLLQQESNDFTLLLIEEPEAHLHPQLQMKLMKFIRDRYNQADGPKLQSILTTHSPNLASKAPLESLILMSRDGRGFSLRKGKTQLEDDDYDFLEKFLDVTKSNLFFAKAVLIVEGDGESILLPTLAKLLGRDLVDYGVSIVNVGSVGLARYAKIFKRKNFDDCGEDSWIPVKVACLRDLDLWPDKAEDKLENKPFGFKQKKEPNSSGRGGNLRYWRGEYTPQDLANYESNKKDIEGQNVKVCLSDDWTFEYALAFRGLALEVYQAANGNTDGFDELPDEEEERAITIYKMVEEGKLKTKVAYDLISVITENYQDKSQGSRLKEKLPRYILDAIEYVTEPLTCTGTED
jgi:putative ATP-dependent endonuclease of the OLD family